jgi:hypothetical protein
MHEESGCPIARPFITRADWWKWMPLELFLPVLRIGNVQGDYRLFG